MAYVGEWGTFIHIPRTGGKWLRWNLVNGMGKGRESGPYHGLPEKLDENRMFTLVRPAHIWYRSIWGYMMRMEWREGGTESPLWNYLTQMTVRCKSDVFQEFIFNMMADYPGMYTWMVESLAPPGVVRVDLRNATQYLHETVGLKYVDTTPQDVTRGLPDISPETKKLIESMEKRHEPLESQVI